MQDAKTSGTGKNHALLSAIDLGKRYDGFTLENVSFDVPAGMVVGLVGSNGAGKTTTIKALLGLIEPDMGSVELFGQSLKATGSEMARLREQVGVVFDTCAFPPDLRVGDVGRMGRSVYSTWDGGLFNSLIEQFGLDGKKKVKDLSRGMSMKLTMAFALAHHPRLLVLDEPTAGLDPLAREEVLELLRSFMEEEDGRGILLSSHITSDLEKIADRVVCVDGGRLIFDCPLEETCDYPGLVRCRTADFEAFADRLAGSADLGARYAGARFMRQTHGVDMLVLDRFAFGEDFPDMACDRATLEDYLVFMLRGELL